MARTIISRGAPKGWKAPTAAARPAGSITTPKRVNVLDLPPLLPASQLDRTLSGLGAYVTFRRHAGKSFPRPSAVMLDDKDSAKRVTKAKLLGDAPKVVKVKVVKPRTKRTKKAAPKHVAPYAVGGNLRTAGKPRPIKPVVDQPSI
jgi:hypothetical protein